MDDEPGPVACYEEAPWMPGSSFGDLPPPPPEPLAAAPDPYMLSGCPTPPIFCGVLKFYSMFCMF